MLSQEFSATGGLGGPFTLGNTMLIHQVDESGVKTHFKKNA